MQEGFYEHIQSGDVVKVINVTDTQVRYLRNDIELYSSIERFDAEHKKLV